MQPAAYAADLGSLLSQTDWAVAEKMADIIEERCSAGHTLFACGNGGSAATASHFIEDVAKGLERRWRALALTDNVPMITALANDIGYEDVFAEQLANFVAEGDVLVAISGSGNSENVLRAVRLAKRRGALTLGWSGFEGGKLKALVDHCLVVPSDSMQRIEDVHLIVAHAIYAYLEAKA